MRKFLKFPFVITVVFLSTISFISCNDDNEPDADVLTEKEKTLQQVNIKYVERNVIPIYKTLADKSQELQEAMEELAAEKNDDNVKAACELWKESRQYWEWSEAFLFGAATKYSIDPHIDTWPLDKTALENLLNNDAMMEDIENVIGNLNNGLLGYHALEYIIFREGKNRPATDITEKELRYAVAVAQDLALNCFRLEAAWAGFENVSDERQEILEEAEMEPEDNFGEQMELAGFPGSVWKTVTAGTEQIIEGCITIVDEVANMKIGAPYFGEDTDYIESPHAYNSIQDFEDNIVGVRFAYYGAMGATSPNTQSVSAYIKSVNAAADQAVIDALDNCIAKIQAMPKPFVLNYSDPKVGEAIEACNNLNDTLVAVKRILTSQD